MLMLMHDPDVNPSGDPQDIPDLGITVPVAVADTTKTREEWEKLIKRTKAPLVVKDVRDPDKIEALTEPKTEEE